MSPGCLNGNIARHGISLLRRFGLASVTASIRRHLFIVTILAVDDDAIVLMGTVTMLEELGHQVVEAYSGKKALETLRQASVDLVIIDHVMPTMTGLQLITAIRQDYPDLPVLLATGYVELPSGADRSLPRLSKPFALEELAGAINAAMSVSRAENVTFLSQRLRQATRTQTSPGPGTSTDSA